jgi:hypothetical protein
MHDPSFKYSAILSLLKTAVQEDTVERFVNQTNIFAACRQKVILHVLTIYKPA